MNSGSVFCERHNGRVSYINSTSTRAPLCAVYHRFELGVLDSSKLEKQEMLRFVLDVTLHNSYSTSRGVTWVTEVTYKNVLKPQGVWLYKQSGHIAHAMQSLEEMWKCGEVSLGGKVRWLRMEGQEAAAILC